MHDLLIRDIGYLMLEPENELADAWLAISNGRVAAVGTAGTEPEARETRSVGGRLVTPGLINTHHHIYQNLTRSYGPVVNGSLFDWLTGLYPIWSTLDDEAVYVSTYIGLTELLLGGCTTSTDHLYVHPRPYLIDAQIRAAQDIGFRFYPTRGSMSLSVKDGGLPPESATQSADVILEDSERLVRKYHDPNPGAMTRIGLAPCSPFSVDDTLMRATAELSEKHDVRMHTHLAEDIDEHDYCLAKYGRTPVEHFEDMGWAGPRSWVAHFIYPSDAEVERLTSAGVGVAHCPSSNMLIGGDTAKVTTLRKRGMPVGLGCDGSASTDHASLWLEARTALLLARFQGGPTAMTARDAMSIATVGSAKCLGWDDELGRLTIGSVADLVAWHLDPVSLAGALSDPVEALLRCGPARAWITVVNGKVLVDEGVPLLPALPDMLREHRFIARRMQTAATH